MARVIAFLVHGVGLPPEGVEQTELARRLFGGDLTAKLREAGVAQPVEIEPIEWHHAVEPPKSSIGFVNYQQIRALMRGFLGAAASFHPPLRTQRLLTAASLAAPLTILPLLCWLAAGAANPGRWPGMRQSLGWIVASLRMHLGGFLALLVPSALFRYGKYAAAALAAAIALAALVHFIDAARHSTILDAVRSALLALVVRPLVFLYAAALSLPVILWFLLYVFAMVMNRQVARPLSVTIHPRYGPVPQQLMTVNDWLFRSFGLSFVVLLLVLVAIWLVVRRAAWFVKVIADVVCFLGDPAVAEALLAQVDAAFASKRAAAGDHLLFVGHSLGSVIFYRWLLQSSGRLAKAQSVTFVTMGSPLRRLVSPFFSAALPPLEEGARALRASIPRFRWLNVYRPFDPIGGRLWRSRPAWCRDQSTGQRTKFHGDYFSDAAVIEQVRRFVESDPPDDAAPPQAAARTPPADDGEIAFHASRGGALATIAAVILGALVGLHASVAAWASMRRDSSAGRQQRLQEIERSPEEVDGWVYVYRETYVPVDLSRDASRAQMPHEIPRHIVLFQPRETAKAVAFDAEGHALAGLGELPVENAAVASSGGFRSALRYPVSVRYRSGKPELFRLPALEPEIGVRAARIFRVFETVLAVFGVAIAFVVVYGVTGACVMFLVRLYCGLPFEVED